MTAEIPADVLDAIRAEIAADTDDEAGEAYRDGWPTDRPLPSHVKVTKPNKAKSVVFSVRLNPEEVGRLEASAEASGIPASTLARGLILNGLAERDGDDLRAALERMERDLLAIKRQTLSA